MEGPSFADCRSIPVLTAKLSARRAQLHFATVDLELHSAYQPGGSETIFDVDRRVAARTTVMPPLPEDRFLCGFSHIFAGGYSAGYYSYKCAPMPDH